MAVVANRDILVFRVTAFNGVQVATSGFQGASFVDPASQRQRVGVTQKKLNEVVGSGRSRNPELGPEFRRESVLSHYCNLLFTDGRHFSTLISTPWQKVGHQKIRKLKSLTSIS